MFVDIFRSTKKDGMYLYLMKGQTPKNLPEPLLKLFGLGEYAMGLNLTEDKKLAQATASNVLKSIEKEGYYLQMPPQILENNSKISNDKLPHHPI